MTRRSGIIATLALLFACTTAICISHQYYPYWFPKDVCFSRNHVVVGSWESCLKASERAIEERTTGYDSFMSRAEFEKCKQRCKANKYCSFYTLRGPQHFPHAVGAIDLPSNSCILFE